MHYIGIDPGVSGGVAVLDDRGAVVAAFSMPETERDLLEALVPYGSAVDMRAKALLERVNAGVFGHGKTGRMGVSSAFTFGKGVGRLTMALTAAYIPFDEISPVTWQTVMQCRSGGDKNITKRRAQQLFPSLPKVTHAIADALLLAECCRRQARQGAHGTPSTPARKDRAADGEEIDSVTFHKGQTEIHFKGSQRGGKTERLRQADEHARGRGARQGRQ